MPLGLAGGYRAGGAKDALFELVKQRMLEQEQDRRAQEDAFQRERANRLDARALDQETYQRGRDVDADKRTAEKDKMEKAKAELLAMTGQPFEQIVDPKTRGLDAPAAAGLPPMPGTNVMGAPIKGVRQGKVKSVRIGDVDVLPKTKEDLTAQADEDMAREIMTRQASVTPPRPASLQHFEGADAKGPGMFAFNPETGKTERIPGVVPKPASSASLTPGDALSATLRLRNDFRRETSAAQTVVKQIQMMESALQSVREGRQNAGSQGVLITFQKILDPESVVRESEYARSAAGLSLWSQLEGQWEKIKVGGAGVPPAELEKFLQTAKLFARRQAEYANVTKEQIDHIAGRYGLDPKDITRDLIGELDRQPGGGDGSGGGATAVGNDGKSYAFPTQAAANAFLAAEAAEKAKAAAPAGMASGAGGRGRGGL